MSAPQVVLNELSKQEEAERRLARKKAFDEEDKRRALELEELTREDPQQPSRRALRAISSNALASEGDSTKTKVRVIDTDALVDSDEVAKFNYTTDATSFWLSYYEMPPELRGYVDALIGMCGDREDFFEATDKELAKRLGKSTKSVQRYRNALSEWQTQHKICFIETFDEYNSFDKESGLVNYHPHRYRVYISKLAVNALKLAANTPEWNLNKELAMELAVEEMIYDVPDIPNRKKKRKKERDVRDQINSQIKRANTAVEDALNMISSLQLAAPGLDLEINQILLEKLTGHVKKLEKIAENPAAEIDENRWWTFCPP